MGVVILNNRFSFKDYIDNRPERTTPKRRYIAEVFCDTCGVIFYPFLENVTRGLTKSCRSCSTMRHGASDTKLYKVWVSIIQRCYNAKDKKFMHYGGRGISVYEDWKNNFQLFKDYMDNLPKEGLTIDRIDNNGNYEPGNVRWATYKTQNLNRRKIKLPVDRKAYMKEYNKKNWKKYKKRKKNGE